MTSIRKLGQFIGMGAPIGLRVIGNYVTSHGELISMRAVIRRLQALPPISLEAEPESTTGEAPFSVTIHVFPSVGLVLETRASIAYATGAAIGWWTWGSSDYAVYSIETPGTYVITITRTGITSTGRTQLSKSLTFSVTPKPPVPAPVLVVSPPSISVQATGDGGFVVTGANFSPNVTVHIRVVDAALTTRWFNQTATAQGTLQYATGSICVLPGQVFFSANDGRSDSRNLTGTLWSNTVTTTCPG